MAIGAYAAGPGDAPGQPAHPWGQLGSRVRFGVSWAAISVLHVRWRPAVVHARPARPGKGETVAEQDSARPGTDPRIPNMARMYDYALGGKDNYAADREAVQKLFSFSPENRDVPRANRRFLGRAVRFAAGQGVRQFVDLGTGLPSQGHVHEVVGEV